MNIIEGQAKQKRSSSLIFYSLTFNNILNIIVLLILAAVSITALTGQDGILTKAHDAVDQTKAADAKEQVQLAVTGSLDNRGNIDKDTLDDNLTKLGATGYDKTQELPQDVTINGQTVTIKADGTVENKGQTGGGSGGSGGGSEVTPGTPVTADTTYTDSDNKEAVIPQGFRVSEEADEQKINTGLVVKGPDGSEFVWVPVDKTTLCADGTADKEMAKLQSGSTEYYEGISYSFSGTTSSKITSVGLGTSSYREPSLVTGSSSDGYTWNVTTPVGTSYDAKSNYYKDILGFNSVSEFGIELNSEFTAIITSIKTNGGFYVGRYEASISGETIKTVKADVYPMTAATSSGNRWYGMYKKEQEYASKLKNSYTEINANLKSAMITGSCYDAMLNWALNGSDKSKIRATVNGNHSGSVATTGNSTYSNDKINNIFDLEGNVYEWTSEAYSTYYRVERRRQLLRFRFSELS